MKCETCLNSRTGISENGYHCVCTLSAKKAANCITNDYKHYVKSPLDIPQKPITNADRIRGMSDEELADWLDRLITHCNDGPCFICFMQKACLTSMIDWLKQEVESNDS